MLPPRRAEYPVDDHLPERSRDPFMIMPDCPVEMRGSPLLKLEARISLVTGDTQWETGHAVGLWKDFNRYAGGLCAIV